MPEHKIFWVGKTPTQEGTMQHLSFFHGGAGHPQLPLACVQSLKQSLAQQNSVFICDPQKTALWLRIEITLSQGRDGEESEPFGKEAMELGSWLLASKKCSLIFVSINVAGCSTRQNSNSAKWTASVVPLPGFLFTSIQFQVTEVVDFNQVHIQFMSEKTIGKIIPLTRRYSLD